MSRVLFFLLIASIPLLAIENKPTTVQWEPYSQALEEASKDKKLVFTYLWATWCISCRTMDKNVFSDSALVNILNTKFHPVKLDVNSKEDVVCDGKRKTVERCFFDVWNLSGVPSFVLIAPKGLSILTLTQTLEAAEMRLFLKHFLAKEKEWVQE